MTLVRPDPRLLYGGGSVSDRAASIRGPRVVVGGDAEGDDRHFGPISTGQRHELDLYEAAGAVFRQVRFPAPGTPTLDFPTMLAPQAFTGGSFDPEVPLRTGGTWQCLFVGIVSTIYYNDGDFVRGQAPTRIRREVTLDESTIWEAVDEGDDIQADLPYVEAYYSLLLGEGGWRWSDAFEFDTRRLASPEQRLRAFITIDAAEPAQAVGRAGLLAIR